MITMISMVGAIAGGSAFWPLLGPPRPPAVHGDRGGLRAAAHPGMGAVTTVLLILPAAFLMQFMVQGAWGVIPVHLNELSPGELRGFFPGFAYQIGVLVASSVPIIEGMLAKHLTYAQSLGLLAGVVLMIGIPVIGLGPEAKGVAFGKAKP